MREIPMTSELFDGGIGVVPVLNEKSVPRTEIFRKNAWTVFQIKSIKRKDAYSKHRKHILYEL
jgi:hypothetical protein